jgi:4,5-dihydroxyphthalate decarboxylase
MSAIPQLSVALNDSDQVRDLVSGSIPVKGAELNPMTYEVEEIFYRSTRFHEWDVAEMSLGKYASLIGRGDGSFVGLPIFVSRSFRHSGIFVGRNGPVDKPEALAGARIGFPEWTVTATIYQRGLLQHEYGIDLTGVAWVQGGINQPGRIETLTTPVPEGIVIRAERQRSLNQLVVDGELDAMLVPRPPDRFTDGSGDVVQLFSDCQQVESAYYRRTGVFPIMHLVVLKHSVHIEHPWLAGNLVDAFTEAKDRSLARMVDRAAPHTPVPWAVDHAEHAKSLFGDDLWPYGVEANVDTLDVFLGYAYEQRLTDRRLTVDDLFIPAVRSEYRI